MNGYYPPVSGERFWGMGVAVAVGSAMGRSGVVPPATVGAASPLVPLSLRVATGVGVTVGVGDAPLSWIAVGSGVGVPSCPVGWVSAGIGVSVVGVSGVLTAVTGGAIGVPVGGSTPPEIGAVAVSVPFNSVFSVG